MRRKLTLPVCICILLLFSANVFGAISGRFSPALNLIASKKADEASIFANQFSIFSHPATGETTVGVLIKFKNASYAGGLKGVGGQVHTVLPSGIATAWLPLRSLDAVGTLDGIEYVELAAKNHLLLDVSRPEIGVDKVHSGQGLPVAYKGKGVIVGTVDSGIDFDHPDFKNPDGSTRVAYIWDQCATEGTPPEGYDYGNECDAAEINSGNCSEQDNNVDASGHGTHVAGIAAGNGRAPNDNADYTGIAPETDIIAVNSFGVGEGSGSDTWIVDAANYICRKAQAIGEPVVINMSLGTHFGPHDGTSLFEQALTELTGPGRIIVVAAGNEGSDFIHLGYQVDDEGEASLFLPSEGARSVIFDVWYSSGYQMDVMIGRVDAETGKVVENTGWIPPGQTFKKKFWAGQEVNIDAAEIANPQNGDSHALMTIEGRGFDQYHWATGFKAHETGQTAIFDCWATGESHVLTATEGRGFDQHRSAPGCKTHQVHQIGLSSHGTGQFAANAQGFKPGDSIKTVSMPATGRNIIAVAAYTTKNQWIDMNGQPRGDPNIVIGERAYFSSIGPSRDGRLKPEIAAPGQFIVAALSSDIPVGWQGIPPKRIVLGGYYQELRGTSMACPHITGTVALMLQRNPSLDYNHIAEIFAKSGRSDQYTGQLPNTKWGYGKVDGHAAVSAAALYGIGTRMLFPATGGNRP
jgi:minor extracellular serine protease Vpr